MVGAGTRRGVCAVWPFGRSAKRRPSALLARPPLRIFTRELLGRKGAKKRPRGPHFNSMADGIRKEMTEPKGVFCVV